MSEPTQRELDKAREIASRNAAEISSNAVPLPGPAGDASFNGPIIVGSRTIRKVYRFDWRVWQQTGNAIALSLAELSKPSEERQLIQDESSECVAVWMLTHTCDEVEAALKAGVESFKKRCSDETEKVMPLEEFNDLFTATMEQVTRSTVTMIKHTTEKEGDGETVFFREAGDRLKTD